MKEIISKTIKIKAPDIMPPTSDYIENEIIKHGIKPLRWAIVDVIGNVKQDKTKTESTIVLSVSGECI